MDRKAFLEYMNAFEQGVIVPGMEQGLFGRRVWAPIRNGKLYHTPLAEVLGTRFWYSRPAVIEYYGLHKRSTGFMAKAQRLHGLLSGFDVPFANFSVVKDYHIKQLAPHLMIDFPDFKAAVVAARFHQP